MFVRECKMHMRFLAQVTLYASSYVQLKGHSPFVQPGSGGATKRAAK